jgi:hypothetical protein
MPLSDPEREELVRQLARRPGHETVRLHLCRALIADLGASPSDIIQEQRIEARSRVDTLLGDTVFEIKSDLRRESDDAETQLRRYLENRERETKRRFVGVATDGLDYFAYELREGALARINSFQARPEAADELFVRAFAWTCSERTARAGYRSHGRRGRRGGTAKPVARYCGHSSPRHDSDLPSGVFEVRHKSRPASSDQDQRFGGGAVLPLHPMGSTALTCLQ